MIFKSYILEQNIQSISKCNLFLFYGENNGLKKDFKKKLRQENKNSEVLNFLQEEIVKNSNILINEITNRSLFDKKKIIFIDHAGDKIVEILEELNENIEDEKIFLFSDALDKRSKLRNFFEKSKIYGISPCYQDNEITIRKIITSKLLGYRNATQEVVNLILQSTGLDRDKVNNEIEKILICFADKKIDINKIELLLNITSNDDFNLLKDEAIKGNKINTNRLLTDTVLETENNIYYLNLINQRINRLKELEKIKKNKSNLEEIISELKPPIFWKDKPIIIEQAKKWNKKKIHAALNKTYIAEIEIKSNSSIRKDLIIKNLIVDLCLTANAF